MARKKNDEPYLRCTGGFPMPDGTRKPAMDMDGYGNPTFHMTGEELEEHIDRWITGMSKVIERAMVLDPNSTLNEYDHFCLFAPDTN